MAYNTSLWWLLRLLTDVQSIVVEKTTVSFVSMLMHRYCELRDKHMILLEVHEVHCRFCPVLFNIKYSLFCCCLVVLP